MSGDQKWTPARNGVNDPSPGRNVGLMETRALVTERFTRRFVGLRPFCDESHNRPPPDVFRTSRHQLALLTLLLP